MGDEKMPAQPKTIEFQAADKQEILLRELKALTIVGFHDVRGEVAGVDEKVTRLEANIDLQGGEIGVVKKDIALMFEWKGHVEQRLKNNSQRAQATSSIDLEHEAKIGKALSKTEELEKAIHETRDMASAAVDELAKQSKAMGIGITGIKWAVSKEGQATLVRFVMLLGVLYTTAKAAGVLK